MEEQQTYSWETLRLISIWLAHDIDLQVYIILLYIYISVDVFQY